MIPSKQRSRVGHLAVGMLIAALMDGPKTQEELSEDTGLNRTTVRGYLQTFRKLKVAHIAEWQPDARNRMTVAAWKLGKGKDAVRRAAKRDNAARMRDYATRKKMNNVLHLLAA
jgi:DNA-binding IclR family transcriptional regulator